MLCVLILFMHRAPTTAKHSQDNEEEMEIEANSKPPSSVKSRRKSNSDGLALTKSGRVSMISNEVNAKYDASYRNSDNKIKLLEEA